MSVFRASGSLANLASSSISGRLQSILRPTAALHTSAVRSAETQRQRHARLVRKVNVEKKAERARLHEENKPHVVLGTRPGVGDVKWRNCDLAKILVTEEQLSSLPTPLENGLKVERPIYASYGLDGLDGVEGRNEQLDFFFQQLVNTSVDVKASPEVAKAFADLRGSDANMPKELKDSLDDLQKGEVEKARHLARIVDLRNANARGIAFENRRRIIATFSPTGTANDSGYPEVQVALLTMRIRNVWNHLMQRKKDSPSRRALRLLVHQRAKMLKYIKRLDRDRYDRVLERVGLEPEAVEGELVV